MELAYLGDTTERKRPALEGALAYLGDTKEQCLKGNEAWVHDEIDTLVNGYDFYGFKGDNSLEDEEEVRNYIARTKRVVDAMPGSVAQDRDPKTFSQMLGYVLSNWDTENREDAIEKMAQEEERMIEAGQIRGVEDEEWHLLNGDEDVYDPEEDVVNAQGLVGTPKKKNGFFAKVKKVMKHALLPPGVSTIVAANSLIAKKKDKKRKQVAASRVKKTVAVKSAGKIMVANKPVTTAKKSFLKKISQHKATNVSGLYGVEDEGYRQLMEGTVLRGFGLGSAEDDVDRLGAYLAQTRNEIAAHPEEYTDSEEELNENVGMLDYALQHWHNPSLREKALDNLAGEGMTDAQYDAFLGALGKSSAKKNAKKAKKAEQKSASSGTSSGAKKKKKKGFFKKIGQGIKKAAKKVGKGIKKVAKKVFKVLVRFNPVTILIRNALLACIRFNLFQMAAKVYPAMMTYADFAAKYEGVNQAEHDKALKGYKKLKKIFCGMGGKEKNLKRAITKGAQKKWKGKEYPADKKDIAAATAEHEKEIQAATAEDMKTEKVDNNAPVLTAEEADAQSTAVESGTDTAEVVAEAAVNGILLGGLGEPATAASSAAASSVIATILAFFKKIGLKFQKVKGIFNKAKKGVKTATSFLPKKSKSGGDDGSDNGTSTTKKNRPVWNAIKTGIKTGVKKLVKGKNASQTDEDAAMTYDDESGYASYEGRRGGNGGGSTKKIWLIGGGAAVLGLAAYLALRKKDE